VSLRATAGRSNAAPAWSRPYNFASSSYLECFGDLPVADGVKLRADTIKYLDSFDPKTWYSDPVTTIVDGKVLTGGKMATTIDSFNVENGSIRYASDAEVDAIIAHMKSFTPKRDYRAGVRAAEEEIFRLHSDALIGNQALDYRKQDGVTEIEESVQANLVERRLNDKLFDDESAGNVAINRSPAFVGCVSNFTNFLDLSRKTLRNIELGVPVVVLSRANTTQHCFRWVTLLQGLLAKHGVEAGLVTYASCELPQQQRIFKAVPGGALYITCSRPVAASARESHGNVMSSTGGPNTLCAPHMTPEIRSAVQLSAMIENSGQCTALRHACIGGATEADLDLMFDDAPTVSTPADALRTGAFAGVFDGTHPAPFRLDTAGGYRTHAKHANIAYRLGAELPPDGLDEMWRMTYVDMSSPAPGDFGTDAYVKSLAAWLVRNQPISLAMNTVGGDLGYARALFEQTGQVVYTVGREGKVALTCQARPQEGEIFGEFPVRRDLAKYTRYPVVIPSPTAAYNCHYTRAHLAAKATAAPPASVAAFAAPLLARVQSAQVKGFCVALSEYLADACAKGPARGDGSQTGGPNRTSLFGLQRPPINGQATVLRCGPATSFDELAPTLLPFFVTNAFDSVRVSVDPANGSLLALLGEGWLAGVPVVAESAAAFNASSNDAANPVYNVVMPEALADNNNTGGDLETFPLVQQFITLYFPVGHIKSTTPDDDAFLEYFRASCKWLRVRE